jgi:GNAT superfamily N-acetyltransferase
VTARCAVWDASDPLPGRIGEYRAADHDAGVALLDQACRDLTRHGARRVVGPMDGDTWHRYRFIVERGDRPAFLMEPDNPDRYVEDWRAAGFEPIAHYISARCADTSRRDRRLDRVRRRLDAAGTRIRPIDLDRLDAELNAIHALSTEAFADHLLYAPLDAESFRAMYRPLREIVVPQLVRLAERDSQLAGYVFALPDIAQAKRGRAIDTLVVKTVAVRSGRMNAGLGQLLMEEAQLAGHALGYTRAIHALMHEHNVSVHMSGHYARPFRRYALFGRDLAP